MSHGFVEQSWVAILTGSSWFPLNESSEPVLEWTAKFLDVGKTVLDCLVQGAAQNVFTLLVMMGGVRYPRPGLEAKEES